MLIPPMKRRSWLKHCGATLFCAALPDSVIAKGFPSDATARQLRDEADLQRAVIAYRFWYPTVSAEGIFQANRSLGLAETGELPVLAAGPRHRGLTLNSDTPYCGGPIDLRASPYVIELPAGPFVGLVNDHHQGWLLDLGLAGPDRGRGGRHLILPPGYEGDVPSGYFVGRSSTFKVLAALRALPINGDLSQALKMLQKIKISPLLFPEKRIRFVDVSDKPMDCTCLQWEDNLAYWEKLHEVIEAEPLLEEFLPMYGLLSALGMEKGKSFSPDLRMKGILEKAARAGRDQMLMAAFNSHRPDRMAWSDRRWEWVGLVPENARFQTPGGLDLEARDRWFIQAIVTSPAMFRRKVGQGSLYWLGLRDSTGAFVDGGRTYRLSVPLPVPAALFWSMTIYDAQTRSEIQTPQDRAAFRSLVELKGQSQASTIDLYVGPRAPAGQENQWIQTIPGRDWFAYFRIYGPLSPAFDGQWKPGDFERMD